MDDLDILYTLLDAAGQIPGGPPDLLTILDDPQWTKAPHTHDWRNHVPQPVKDVWGHLPTLAQLTAYLPAAIAADREEHE